MERCADVSLIVVVCHPERVDEYREVAVTPLNLLTPVTVVAGGETRQRSVEAGLAALGESVGTVLVHDGARPMVTSALVSEMISTLEASGADGVVIGCSAVDTMKVVRDELVVETLDRESLWAVQTPQVFTASSLRAAHRSARESGFEGTDDASLVERIGGTVRVKTGPRDNVKVTFPEDLARVDMLLRLRERE